MAQIVPIQPSLTPHPPGGSPPAVAEHRPFSPHLQKALNDRTGQNGPNSSPPNTTTDQSRHRLGRETSTDSVTDQLDQYPILPEKKENDTHSFQPLSGISASSELAQLFAVKESTFSQTNTIGVWSQAADDLVKPSLSTSFAQGQMLQAGIFPEANNSDSIFRFTDSRAGQLPANQVNLVFAVGSDAQPLTGGEGKSANHRDTLLGQLQQIIANSSETGRVAINASQQSSANTETSVSPSLSAVAQFVGVNSSEIELLGTTAERPSQQFPGLRQNIHQQYYEAKMSQFSGQDAGAEEQQPQNETGRQTASLTAAAASASSKTVADSGATFHQTLLTGQEPAPLLATDTGRAIPLPGATQIHDHQVMQQVIERFQLNKRPLETQINIRLHPAELGALKIDLTVSEGSIRASVVAQSQQVQEIIERNLARLRSILEGQGFTIDSLVVTSESEAVGEFNQFDSRPFQHGTPSSQLKASGQPAATEADFEPLIASGIRENRVVNVKI